MRKSILLLLGFVISPMLWAQQSSSSHILHRIEKLQNPLRVLYLAAHPDDENTRMISWLANDVGAQTAYLSLTRGDGGQNLIGTELGAQLGVLRTQELMQARKIDGGQQFFSRAVDFGYSKTPEETFEQWDRQQVLSDVVRVIRQFQPQIIITRFPPDRRAGHGHHTASAMLALEAFEKAADPEYFKELELGAWQVDRIFWNHSSWWEPNIDSLAAQDDAYYVVDVGSYLPKLGLSCNELASHSRSQHKSQGFGVSVARGSQKEYLKLMKGECNGSSIFSGLPQSWSQKEQVDLEKQLGDIVAQFDLNAPYKSAYSLMDLYERLATKDNRWQALRAELAAIIADCLGLKVELLAEEEYAVPGESLNLEFRAISRSPLKLRIHDFTAHIGKPKEHDVAYYKGLENNELFIKDFKYTLDESAYSQPYWLKEDYEAMFTVKDKSLIGRAENKPSLSFPVAIALDDRRFEMTVPVRYKFSDRVEGEIERPLMIVPPLTVDVRNSKLFFLNDDAQELEVDFRAFKEGDYQIEVISEGWAISPSQFELSFEAKHSIKTKVLKVAPKLGAAPASLTLMLKEASSQVGESYRMKPLQKLVEIDYPHIDKRMILEDPAIRLLPLNLKKRGQRVAYIKGAGDKVPEAIMQMGYQLDILDENGLREADLSQYQAVVIGIRAYNTQDWLFNRKDQLLEYVENGGNMIVQYNTRSRSFQGADFAPYPFTISRERVTEENAKVRFALADHPVLNEPNDLSQADFDNWVQERGLYFAREWDQAYRAPLAWHDKGEPDRLGGLLLAHYGKGAFIYTGISFFRELPAGVTGAYRLMANLISYQHED